jgi:phosphoribosylanthranilate isomerase
MPSGAGIISEDLIAEIVPHVPPSVSSFLLTCRQDVASIIDQQRRLRTTTLQICDRLHSGNYSDLRKALPGIAVVQVVHVNGPESVEEARLIADEVDAILLDSGNQALPVKELGGTGRTHDWKVSAQIREAVDIPVFLAGGLNPENVSKAIEQVRPFGVDVCTGVRTDGKLDRQKLSAFMSAIRK